MKEQSSSPEQQQTEIERKFLIKELPFDPSEYESKSYKQGYLVIDQEGGEARVRSVNDESWTMTVKHGKGMTRGEYEISIDQAQFEELWPATDGRRIEKVRVLIPCGDHTIELDIFENDLEGLVLAEVEFTNEAEAHNFVTPAWFGEDVTKDSLYKNQSLASRST